MPQPIALYYWPTPNGWKISIALEEMGLPYEVRLVNINKGEQFKPDYLALNPNNRMPTIIDPDGPDGAPLPIFESGAILQYLARKSGRFYGSDEPARVAIDQWLFWQAAHYGPTSGQVAHFKSHAKKLGGDAASTDYAVARFWKELDRLWGVMERQLGAHDFIAGPDYSIADMMLWPWLVGAHGRGEIKDFPRILEWFERVGARPAVQRGKLLHDELRNPPVTAKESAQHDAVLYGQTARSVADAASKT